MATLTEGNTSEKDRQKGDKTNSEDQHTKKSVAELATSHGSKTSTSPSASQDKRKHLNQEQQQQTMGIDKKTDISKDKVPEKKISGNTYSTNTSNSNGSNEKSSKRRDRRTKGEKHHRNSLNHNSSVEMKKDGDRKEKNVVGDKKDCAKKKREGGGAEDADPFSGDLYERLCAENRADADALDWDGGLMGKGLVVACKRMPYLEKYFHTLLMLIFMGVTLAMVFGLCVLQAQMSMHTKEMLAKVQGPKKSIPEGMYTLYFDYLDSSVLPENVDLKANTSIFVH